MIKIKPFKAIRPPRDKAYLVATRSYLSYSEEELDDKLRNNPYSFMHVINPKEGRDLPFGVEKYGLVKDNYKMWCDEGVFIAEEKESYYLYSQVKDGNEYIGIIAAISAEDYVEGRIKKHEQTLSAREEMFTDYLEETGFNAEPVLLIYQDDFELNQLFARYIETRAEYEFTSTDMVYHRLWPIDCEADLDLITQVFAKQDALYIADGHHRCASSARLAERCKKKGVKSENSNYFMAFMIGEEQMKIYDFNRLLINKTGKSKIQILQELEQQFYIEPKHNETYRPQKIHEIGMFIQGEWFKLSPKMGSFDPTNAVGHLDAEILSRNILNPIFEVKDLKMDRRVDFMPGTEGPEGLERAVNHGDFDVAFSLFPVSMEQIKTVSDEEKIMPPKSTYIEPKLRSGLIIYSIE
jgi:uncharacterized protein (DUF1015 family)